MSLLSSSIVLSSCGGSQGKEERKKKTSRSGVLIAGDDSQLATDQDSDQARNALNSAAGNWKLVYFKTTQGGPKVKGLYKLYQNNKEGFSMRIDDPSLDSNGKKQPGNFSVQVNQNSSQHSCTVTVSYPFSYCCNKMRKITLEPNLMKAQESTPGCSQHAFGQNLDQVAKNIHQGITTIVRSYEEGQELHRLHFTFYQRHLNIRAPWDISYENRLDQPMTEWKLIQIQ